MKTVNARRRWLGTFFLLIALLLLIDWGIALLFHMFHIGSGVALLLRIHQIHRGVFSGIGMVLCPGNGFAAFCGPLWLLLYFLFVVQVVVAPVFNRTRARRLKPGRTLRAYDPKEPGSQSGILRLAVEPCRIHLPLAFRIFLVGAASRALRGEGYKYGHIDIHQRPVHPGLRVHRPLLVATPGGQLIPAPGLPTPVPASGKEGRKGVPKLSPPSGDDCRPKEGLLIVTLNGVKGLTFLQMVIWFQTEFQTWGME